MPKLPHQEPVFKTLSRSKVRTYPRKQAEAPEIQDSIAQKNDLLDAQHLLQVPRAVSSIGLVKIANNPTKPSDCQVPPV